MRFQAVVIVAFLTSLSGCAHWPSAEHRDVTLDRVEVLLEQYCQPAQSDDPDLDGIQQSLNEQQQRLDTLTHSIDRLAQRPVSQVPRPAPAPQCQPALTKATTVADSKVVVGATEWVFLSPPGRYLSARVDTGAETSSISARNIVRFERDGKRWVSFDLDTGNADNDIHLEVPLERNVLIRQASFDDVDRRPVVVFDVKLGDNLHQPTEFTLADRSRMSYPVLLGRSFLKDVAVVDVGQEFIHPRSKKR